MKWLEIGLYKSHRRLHRCSNHTVLSRMQEKKTCASCLVLHAYLPVCPAIHRSVFNIGRYIMIYAYRIRSIPIYQLIVSVHAYIILMIMHGSSQLISSIHSELTIKGKKQEHNIPAESDNLSQIMCLAPVQIE